MAALDYSAAPPFIRANKSITLSDNTSGTPVTLTLLDYTGEMTVNEVSRASASYKPNGRRPAAGAIVLETDDQEVELTVRVGLRSYKGNTAHTPLEFMKGETVNSVALTSFSSFGKFLFQLVETVDSTANGGGSQTVTYSNVEYVSQTEVMVDGILYQDLTLRAHVNKPAYA